MINHEPMAGQNLHSLTGTQTNGVNVTEDLEGIHYLIEQIRKILIAIKPANQFRNQLKQELLLAAQQKQTSKQMSLTAPSREFLFYTAMLGFIVSLAGFFFARRWNNPVIVSSP